MKCIWTDIECEFVDGDKCNTSDLFDCPENKAINELVKQGHTRHCASRIHFGDGECECKKGIKEGA